MIASPGRCLRCYGAVMAALLAGCAINPRLELTELTTAPRVVDGVPFHPQEDFQCGPAALAGVLGASGVAITPQALVPQVYLPDRRGSLQIELMTATRRAGRIAYRLDPDPAALVAEIDAGRPVLVMQNLRTPRFPVWHFAVVVGHAPADNRFVLNSGTERGRRERAPAFLRTWGWADRWAMLTLAPGELPASVEPVRYFEAVAAFEPFAAKGEAETAWRAAALRWPRDPRPLLALGNLAYADGDLERAARHFSEGLALTPGDVVLANNLASVLGELGCPRAGESILAPVAAVLRPDSPWHDAVAGTRAELAARTAPDQTSCAKPLR